MDEPTDTETAAMQHAGFCAGAYIDSLGKTDMAAWSEVEWMQFIEAVCTGYVDALVRRMNEVMTAYGKVKISDKEIPC